MLRRRVALVMSALVAATFAALVPTAAQAVVVDGGLLAPGVATTVQIGDLASASFDLQVPAGARVSVTATSIAPGLTVVTGLNFPNQEFAGSSDLAQADPSTWYAEFRPAQNTAAPTTAKLAFGCASCFGEGAPSQAFSFVVHIAQDIVRDVAAGEVVDLDFTDVAQQARLTTPTGGRVSVWVESDALTSSVPPIGTERFVVKPSNRFDFMENQAGFICCSSPGTLVVDPVGAFTGHLVLRVNVAPPFPATEIRVGSPNEAFLFAGEPGGAVTSFFEASGGAHTLVHVQPQLDSPDGTARLDLAVPGEPVRTLGTVSGGRTTFDAGALPAHALVVLRAVYGPGVSGRLSVRVRLDPGPSTPIPFEPSTITVPAGTDHATYGIDVAEGETVELYLGAADYSDPAVTTSNVSVVTAFGEQLAPVTLSSGGPASLVLGPGGAEHYDLVVAGVPGSDLAVDLLAARRATVSTPLTDPVDRVVAIAEVGQQQEFVLLAKAHRSYLVTVTDESLTGGPGPGNEGSVVVLLGDQFVASETLASGGSVLVEAGPGDVAADLRILVDGADQATGTVHLSVVEAPVVAGVLPVGTPTTITLSQPRSVARYTFEGTAGQQFAFDFSGITVEAADARLERPDGSVVDISNLFAGGTGWIDPVVLDVSGTWTLVVDPWRDLTGSVTVTRLVPRVVTGALTLGATRTVSLTAPGDSARFTFRGIAGQRPAMEFPRSTVAVRVQIFAPDGTSVYDNGSFAFGTFLEGNPLTQTGTYTLVLDPQQRDTGSLDLRFTLVTDPVRLVESGQKVQTTFAAGQNPTFTIQTRAGRRIGLLLDRSRLTGVEPSQDLDRIFVYNPNGELFWQGVLSPTGWFEAPPTDVAGKWSVVYDAGAGARGRITSTVWAAADKELTNRIGRATAVSVDTPVQNVVLPFTSTGDGSFVRWQLSGAAFTAPGAQLRLVAPFGFDWATQPIAPGTTSGVLQAPLFFEGTWQLVVDGVEGSTGSARITFSITSQPF